MLMNMHRSFAHILKHKHKHKHIHKTNTHTYTNTCQWLSTRRYENHIYTRARMHIHMQTRAHKYAHISKHSICHKKHTLTRGKVHTYRCQRFQSEWGCAEAPPDDQWCIQTNEEQQAEPGLNAYINKNNYNKPKIKTELKKMIKFI